MSKLFVEVFVGFFVGKMSRLKMHKATEKSVEEDLRRSSMARRSIDGPYMVIIDVQFRIKEKIRKI